MDATWESSDDRLAVELERAKIGLRMSAFGEGVRVFRFGGMVFLDSPPYEEPRRQWYGTESDLLAELGRLPDGAGIEACWVQLKLSVSRRPGGDAG